MFFSDALDIHESFHPKGSHGDILGDGFLMNSNPIYRNVKEFSLKIGCKYVEAYPEYLLLPFHELPGIVERKEIPYVPAARLMKKVEQASPGVFSTEDVPMPESYHLHEAAHVIADHFLKKIDPKSQQEEILKSIMAESFANTVDALTCTGAVDDVQYFFIKQNCYMHPRKNVIQAMNSLSESLGFRFVFMLTYFTYLHANFLAKSLSKKFVQELVEHYALEKNLDAKLKKHIQTVCDIGEKLDPLFRVTTTGNYFKQQGIEGDIHDLLDFPFMKILADQKGFRKALEALCDSIALKGGV